MAFNSFSVNRIKISEVILKGYPSNTAIFFLFSEISYTSSQIKAWGSCRKIEIQKTRMDQ